MTEPWTTESWTDAGRDALPISSAEVNRLANCPPNGRWVTAVDDAIRRARHLIAPRGQWRPLTRAQVETLFSDKSAVAEIAKRGRATAFVATIGPALEKRVHQHFDDHELLEGVLLDAAGSAATEAVCDLVQQRAAKNQSAARFSPGYCFWPVTAQRPLLALLQPAELGVSLLPSMLMLPLKTVSGLVVSAEPNALRIPPTTCVQCPASGCTRRRTQTI